MGINQERQLIQKIVTRAGCLSLMSISPPPIIGGHVLQNLNPFDMIFDAPYGVNVIPTIIDAIDQSIGFIKNNKLYDDFIRTLN